MKNSIFTLLLSLFTIGLQAQNHHKRFESIDIQHYSFEIHLNDSTNIIEGKTTVSLNLLKPVQQITLDLKKQLFILNMPVFLPMV